MNLSGTCTILASFAELGQDKAHTKREDGHALNCHAEAAVSGASVHSTLPCLHAFPSQIKLWRLNPQALDSSIGGGTSRAAMQLAVAALSIAEVSAQALVENHVH